MVQLIFRDLRIICVEKIYFTIIHLNFFFFFLEKYIPLIISLDTLSFNYINSVTCKSGEKIANEIPNIDKIGISKQKEGKEF